MSKIKKAIIPAAGYGTRFLPATKAIPKEMLPIVDRPSIEYVVEECVESGITEICILLGRGKNSIENHFDRNYEVEDALQKAGKRAEIALMNKFLGKASFTFIRQPSMRGTGAAINLCKSFTAGEPFAVLFGDDVIYNKNEPVTAQLIRAYEATNSTIVGVQELSPQQAVSYGVVVPGAIKGRYVQLKGFKEKPPIDQLPSRLASLGRFVLTPDIFSCLDITPPAPNGEVYLPTAIEILASSANVYAYNFEGKRYDIGSKQGYLEANIEYALRSKALKSEFLEYLRELAGKDYIV
ncbi:MAG: UTP--glucose-1-phosphate uridylyltransferase [Clostridia bacterium]